MSRCCCWLPVVALVSFLIVGPRAYADDEISATADQLAFFESKIRPLLADRCLDCHSGDEPESGLNLESRQAMLRGGELGPAVIPGQPRQSLLISAINHDEYIKMPPKQKLPTVEVVNLTRWVEMGAPWPHDDEQANDQEPILSNSDGTPAFTAEQTSFWAFQRPARPNLPEVVNQDWPQTATDYFVLEKLEEAGLTPAPPADKETLIRRATYDLIGLPPEPHHIAAFLRDTSPDAYTTVIDRLLASPHYGEHWGRHWLDVARYADSNGLDENLAYANAFRYRDYVISAVNADKPYDRFVQEQIAGDLLDDADPNDLDRFIATGFLAIGAKMLAEDDPVKMQMDIIDEQLNTLCQVFMGLTIGCARCHDHKFDPLPTEDYYALAGIFKSSKTMENHNVVARWFERPLVDAQTADQMATIDRNLAANQEQIDAIQTATRQRAKQQTRTQVADYLLATVALEQFDQEATLTLSHAQSETKCAHSVSNGYALIEAEAFHRGNIERTTDGYGEGIGVILSRGAGFVEYDVDVSHAGTYDLELRYAAENSRPVHAAVNGEQVASNIAGRVTGSWYPPGQKWFAEGQLVLTAGRNTIRFESDSVYPHVDKFALVYSSDGEWPFQTDRPLSVGQVAAKRGLKIEMVRQWQSFLNQVAANELPEQTAFLPWIALREVAGDQFPRLAATLFSADDQQDTKSLRNRVPEFIQREFAAAPKSLDDAAALYQRIVNDFDQDAELAKQFSNNASPLSGPATLKPFFSTEEQDQLDMLTAERNRLEQSRPRPASAMGVTDSQSQDLRVHLRGSHITLGQPAPRRFPRIIAGTNQTPLSGPQSGRLELARWLTASHPLTSRVMVNRVWHWHFGRGIVASVDNFGRLGNRPTHPRLLDWLAVEFEENNWSLKQLHRSIMLSSTYQMSSAENSQAASIDPENTLLWRVNRRRLNAEEARDSIVAVGTGLDPTMGGSLLTTKNHEYVTSTTKAGESGEYDNWRRSIYLPVIRSAVYDVFQTLDFPDPAFINGRRQTSTVAPQALMMMNSDLVEEQTGYCAAELLAEPLDDEQRIQFAYQRVLRRAATLDEMTAALDYLARARSVLGQSSNHIEPHGAQQANDQLVWQSLCRILVSTNEFVYID